MTIDPFKSTAYDVGRITRCFTSDVDGNLIFRDLINPSGVTLTQLLNALLSQNISFDSQSSFFEGVNNVADALEFLNQFAYLKYNSRFIYVDSTIPNSLVRNGEIYNSLEDAITYANTLTFNGYNSINILLYGCHRPSVLDNNSSLNYGIYELDGGNPTIDVNSGIRLLGIGDPVIRLRNFTGVELSRKNLFNISSATNDPINILFQDISFEVWNSDYCTIFNVENAPVSDKNKTRNGVFLKNIKVNFAKGTQRLNRVVDVSSPTPFVSNIVVEDFKLGDFYEVSNISSDPIELFRINHHTNSSLTIKNIRFGDANQPNEDQNVNVQNIKNLKIVRAIAGKAIVSNCVLDEMFFWNGVLNSNVFTKLVHASNNSKVSLIDIGIIRNPHNTNTEISYGATTILDWVTIEDSAKLNTANCFDEYYNVELEDVPTTGLLKETVPVKSFWYKDKLAFGVGNRGEIRLGKPTLSEINALTTMDTSKYGVPLWYNDNNKSIQYFDGTSLHTLGSSVAASNGISIDIDETDWQATSYSIDSSPTYFGFEYVVTHNLGLVNQHAFSYTLFDRNTNTLREVDQIIPIDNNSFTVIVVQPFDARIVVQGIS